MPVYIPESPKGTLTFPDLKEEKSDNLNNDSIENDDINQKFTKKQRKVVSDTLLFGFNFTGVTTGIVTLLLVPEIKGLTVDQKTVLKVLGSCLFSYCLIKCHKYLFGIGRPVNGKKPIISDDEEVISSKETKCDETPKTYQLKRK